MNIRTLRKWLLVCLSFSAIFMAAFAVRYYHRDLLSSRIIPQYFVRQEHGGVDRAMMEAAKRKSVINSSSSNDHKKVKSQLDVSQYQATDDASKAKAKTKEKKNNTRHEAKSFKENTTRIQVELFPDWTTSDPHDQLFTRRVYIYSAIVALHNTPPSGTEVQIVTFHEGKIPTKFICCAKLSNGTIHIGRHTDVEFTYAKFWKNEKPNTKDLNLFGVVYRCRFSFTSQQFGAGHVALTTATCPTETSQYMAVVHPEKKPGGLALCAKIAYGHDLKPRKLIEWFEMQRLLGVDRIQLFDLNNTDTLRKLFRHYQNSGFLNLLPYKLPGRPWNRTIFRGTKMGTTWGDEKELPIWDCKLRLAGYDYIMGVDLDEIIVPRNYTVLKPFIQSQFKKHPEAGAIFFHAQFFLEEWVPVDRDAPLLFLQRLNSTEPRWECQKHIYLPARISQAATHHLYYRKGSKGYRVPPAEAAIFHYRKCPHVWKNCKPKPITDRSMLRFKDHLLPAVTAVNHTLGL